MLLEVKLRLFTPVLGGLRPDQGGVRRFQRTNGRLLVSQFHFEESIGLASHNLGMASAEAFLRFEHTCLPPTIVLYDRRYRAGGAQQRELFEAFRKGTVITFKVILRDDIPGCPSLPQVQQLFELAGEFAGMSPFGGKFGMGRFSVEQIGQAISLPANMAVMEAHG